ncbi:SIS domain-containing protein [Gilliamella apicola]|uniref:Glucosamine--fructose-6-phosphate aminotransferase n=1 Tax=Gilliamella apicola TaxID=1196095 RepID=A0A242NL76_9GAMM|nr:SIS domain-containing protein [Gilliamella apicola]OTP82703.1 glucosamine--fructose-6-phosphate aminotransferase [Gilliamella apicola]OTP85873.1 glucosamine--fructose-6-phosphate aminotransferase [Gilliamella apicola]OTP91895.1 glucosamine--fructose-6-phosphate aminotransferase [Gilliamella apicola]OTQ01435.1 glucosamine--fructose-6-phosphate aminotransferase [Gilliamella apicola]OTQ11710.1 glucosamine--fructose-6-phosphate aminotransferase [Gilliamella apicola]
MKSIADYVALEPEYYQNILDNYQTLFTQHIDLSKIKQLNSIVIFATGSSSNAAYGARSLMSKILKVPVYIEDPSIAANYLHYSDPNTLYFAISQGGESYSTIHLVEEFIKNNQTIYTLTSNPNSPLYKVSNHVLSMGIPIEEMPYVSAGYSVTILDLILISLVIAQKNGNLNEQQFNSYLDQLQKVTHLLPKVIEQSQMWVNQYQNQFYHAKRVIFIGYGATYGVAREGETKFTETVRNTAFGKELEEYMHGPYLGLHEDDHIVFLEPHGQLAQRANLLKVFLDKYVKNVSTIYANNSNNLKEEDLCLNVDIDELYASLFMTVPVHLLSYQVSRLKGHNLEKSTYPEFDEITSSKIKRI